MGTKKCGAGYPISAVHFDGVWRIEKDMDGFRITNKHSERVLYAAEKRIGKERRAQAGHPATFMEMASGTSPLLRSRRSLTLVKTSPQNYHVSGGVAIATLCGLCQTPHALWGCTLPSTEAIVGKV